GNTLEALIGAIYLDKGYEKTKKIVINRIVKQLISFDELEKREFDFKSRIIEWAQKSKSEIVFESQEDYTGKSNTPIFISRIVIDNQILGEGRGTSKKEAEQNAAEQALTYIDVK
ncbi:MAG TPA: putative dsRNA-binding protein, partial [Bacteroidales bacterium]|nr:putative dsRNA-binding protein [Bacteroidales bacterium]